MLGAKSLTVVESFRVHQNMSWSRYRDLELFIRFASKEFGNGRRCRFRSLAPLRFMAVTRLRSSLTSWAGSHMAGLRRRLLRRPGGVLLHQTHRERGKDCYPFYPEILDASPDCPDFKVFLLVRWFCWLTMESWTSFLLRMHLLCTIISLIWQTTRISLD